MSRVRVLIADDHPGVLERVSRLLEAEYDVVGAVTDGLAAVDAAMLLQPDIVVLDVTMPILSGLEAAAQLVEVGYAPRIVFLTVHEDPAFVQAARDVGAQGYVLKRTITADLVPAIERAIDGHPSFPDGSGA